MAETRQIALGTVIKINDDTLGYDTQPLVQSYTPPNRTRAEVDSMALEDTLEVPILGIESKSEITLTQFWHPGETEHEKFDTLFGTKATFGVQMVTPHGTAKTQQCDCKVLELSPETLDASGLFRRTVKLLRVGAITLT